MNIVIINTKYKENYGAQDWDGKGECPQHWKNKGRFKFSVNMDVDLLTNEEESCIETIKQMLKAESSNHESFEYIDYEILWQEPKKLYANTFISILREKVKQKYK